MRKLLLFALCAFPHFSDAQGQLSRSWISALPPKASPSPADLVPLADANGNGYNVRVDKLVPPGSGASEQTVGDANSTWPDGVTVLRQSAAQTAARTSTLPHASAYVPGFVITYFDYLTTGNYGRAFSPASGDTLDGATSAITPFIAGGRNGNNKMWQLKAGTNSWRSLYPSPRIFRFSDPNDDTKEAFVDSSNLIPGSPAGFLLVPGTTVPVPIGDAPPGSYVYGFGIDGVHTQPFPGSSRGNDITLTESAGVISWTWDPTVTGEIAAVTLHADDTLSIAGAAAPGFRKLYVTQDSAGGHKLTGPPNTKTPAGMNSAIGISTAPNSETRIEIDYHAGFFNIVPTGLNLTTTYVAAGPSPDLLWWKCNDGTGTTVTADVGPNGTLTTAGWTTSTQSGSGSAISLTAGQTLTSNSSISFGVPTITASFWIWMAAWSTNSTVQDLMTLGSTGNTANTFRIYADNNHLSFRFQGTSSGSPYVLSVAKPSNSSWHFIQIVMDNTVAASTTPGGGKIYIDGALQTAITETSSKTGTPNFASQVIKIGGTNTTAYFDDIRLNGHELTATEGSTLYAAGAK